MAQHYRPFVGRTWYARYIIALLCVSLFLSGCLSSDTPQRAISWQEQQKMMREAVDKVAPDAYLYSAVVLLKSSILEDNHRMYAEIRYIRASGQTISLSYTDTQITDTLEIMSENDYYNPEFSSKPLPTDDSVANWMQLSASAALDRTLDEGRAFLDEHHSLINPVLSLYTDVEDIFGIPAAWSVAYSAPPHHLRFWVDAQSGEILGRVSGLADLYPTPLVDHPPPTVEP